MANFEWMIPYILEQNHTKLTHWLSLQVFSKGVLKQHKRKID